MSKIHRMRFLAEADICSPREITKTLTVVATIDRRVAKRRFKAHLGRLRNGSKFAAMYPLEAVYIDKQLFYDGQPSRPSAETDVHEKFHMRAERKGVGMARLTCMEESAAYAFESTLLGNGGVQQREIAERVRMYHLLARHCVRFMYALELPEPNGLLRSSVQGIRRIESSKVVGDNRAIAFGNAKNLLLYLECIAVLKRWGTKDAEKIFFEAMEVAEKEGLDKARKFLLRNLTRRARDELSDRYGLDMRKYRCRSPSSPDLDIEILIWDE
ncbi:MAG: hypothetical protein ABID61_02075 [Candidatus Micrarchaeota archaeon]